MQEQIQGKGSHARFLTKWLLYSILGIGAILLPPVLARIELPIFYSVEYDRVPVVDLFVFLATGALLVISYFELKDQIGLPLRQVLPTVVPLLLALHFLIIFKQFPVKSWDYECFETGARAIVEGGNLYGDCYLYWPLLAQGMTGLFYFVDWSVGISWGRGIADPNMAWDLIFYLYQCGQFLMILGAYFLLHRFATNLGLDSAVAAVLIAVLFIFSNSMYATVHYNQMGLLLLNLCLLSILLLKTHPVLSGLIVAFGGHTKLYPYILMMPWTFKRHWKALLGIFLGSAAILFVQTSGGRHWELWQQYIAMARAFPVTAIFRDNSVQNIVHNTFRQFGFLFQFDLAPYLAVANGIVLAISLAMLGWYIWRFRVREQAIRQAAALDAPQRKDLYEQVAMYGHSAEAIAFALMISPMVWEHHYVMTLPLALWSIATVGRKHPWLVGAALVLMMGLPTFNVYPFSYHRLAGLVLLLVATSPRRLPAMLVQPQTSAPEPEAPGLHGTNVTSNA